MAAIPTARGDQPLITPVFCSVWVGGPSCRTPGRDVHRGFALRPGQASILKGRGDQRLITPEFRSIWLDGYSLPKGRIGEHPQDARVINR